MADTDWGSLASSILPGILGAALGSPALGAYGASAGLGRTLDRRLEVDKLNTDIAFKNQQHGMEQQRIDQSGRHLTLQEEQMEAEQKRWALLDRQAEANVRNLDLQTRQMQEALNDTALGRTRREEYRKTLPPKDQPLFDQDPKHYMEQRLMDERMKGAGAMLGQFGLKNGDEMARMLGPQGVSHLLASLIESRNKPRENFGFHFDPTSGQGFVYDKHSGAITVKKISDPKVPVENRMAVRRQMLNEWEKTHPVEKESPEASDLFEEYATSPEGVLQEAYLLRRIKPEEYNAYRSSLRQQDKADEVEALERMKEAYMAAGPNQTEAGFQNYLASPKTKAAAEQNLTAYKRAVKQGTFRQQRAPLQRAEQPKTEASGRPSLESIFGTDSKVSGGKQDESAKESLLRDFGL